MTQLQRLMILTFIAESIGGFNEVLPEGFAEVLLNAMESELDDIGDDEEVREDFERMAKKLYDEIIKEEQGE